MTTAAVSGRGITAGIDIGGTKTAVVVTDDQDNLLDSRSVATDRSRIVGQVAELILEAAARRGPDEPLKAVGIAAPGQVDSASGTVRLAVNLGPAVLDLRGGVESSTQLPVHVEHDALAAAIWLHSRVTTGSRPARSLAYLAVGTGISAGVVQDGQPLHGMRGIAGEVGHVVALPGGPACGCGLVGCLEAVAAGPAIARRAAALVASADVTTAMPPQPTPEQVFECARLGDAGARQVVDEVAAYLARAIRGLVLSFGVEAVFVGGGVARAGDALAGPLLAAIDAERATSPLVAAALDSAGVQLVASGELAGARGAALVARRAMEAAAPARHGGKGVIRER